MKAFGIIFIIVLIITSAIFVGVYFAAKEHIHRNPPSESLHYRVVDAETNPQGDTLIVNVTDKRVYYFKTLSDEQKRELREAIK